MRYRHRKPPEHYDRRAAMLANFIKETPLALIDGVFQSLGREEG